MEKKDYELIITYKCNWDCEYCCVDTHSRNEPSNIFSKIELIEENSLVTLSGGEPGMLSRKKIISIIDKLLLKKCTICLNTNGLFIKKYKDLLKYFDKINYHISQNVDINDKFTILESYYNVDYILIIHDMNYKNIELFFEKYPNILFNVIPASNPDDGIKNGPELSKKLRNLVATKYYKNLNRESRYRLLFEKDFSNIIYLKD